jgi:hypothetical protein
MLFFAIVCVTVIGLARMNVNYYFFFERRGILEQATLTFAESLAKNVKANAEDWWNSGAIKTQGDGEYIVSGDMTDGQPMRFTYVVSPDKDLIYKLFVRGERDDSKDDVAWGVWIDIDASSKDITSADGWSKVVRIR